MSTSFILLHHRNLLLPRHSHSSDSIRAVDTIAFTERAAAAGGGVHIHYSADIGLRGWKCLFNPFIGGTLQKLTTRAENGCRTAFAEKKHEK
jgi:hypothetical protein